MTTVFFAALRLTRVDKKDGGVRTIRFSKPASKKLVGAEYCRVRYTPEYIVIEPIQAEWQREGDPSERKITWDDCECAIISITASRHSIYLPDKKFGKRYLVKKDKAGKLYVCLNQEVS